MNKKIIFSLVTMFFLISIVSAATSYCCEKTNYGAWCQNDEESNCDNTYKKAPTRCDSTDYCRLGCCYNSDEGTCMQNTAQKICEDSDGVWTDEADCSIPQCELGCCQIGDQAAFVTQTRCKRLSSLYGLGITFKSNIKSEIECVSTVISKEKGACVFEKDFERTCSILTREECIKLKVQDTEVEFYAGRLCSDEDLATNCGPSDETTCVEGKDQVYFLDTCGNLANIYDSTKRFDKNYWAIMKNQDESCNAGESNADSSTCGNCDYFAGSTCKEYESGVDNTRPEYGDNICRDLACEYEGERYEHGETWCSIFGGVSQISNEEPAETNATQNLPGSRYYRLLCYNGEVSVEPCADFRQEICMQGEVNNFRTAACRVNRWEECVVQSNRENCLDEEKRDCKWVGRCIPRYAPGFNFWESEEDAEQICELGNANCVMTYKKDINGKWYCKDNCDCGKSSWANSKNNFCVSLGDCGSSINYLDVSGYYSPLSLRWISGKLDNQEEIEEELAS